MKHVAALLAFALTTGCGPHSSTSSRGPSPSATQSASPQPDAQGVYRVGGLIEEPYGLVRSRIVVPDSCRQSLRAGYLEFEVVVTVDGDTRDIAFKNPNQFDPPCPAFETHAVAAIATWKYQPTTLRGIPVPVLLTFRIPTGRL